MPICKKCGADLPEEDFYKSISHRNRDTTCKKCRIQLTGEWQIANHAKKIEIEKKWIVEHPERNREIKREYKARHPDLGHEYYENNREEHLSRTKKHNLQLRKEMVSAYGGRCSCCGEDRFEFLTLEHKNGDGAAHRKGHGLYTIIRQLKLAGWPKEDYTILCWNCNSAKYVYGICPHDREREEV